MKIGFIKASDDFLDEVSRRAEMAPFSEQQRRRILRRRFGAVSIDALATNVQNRLQVTVYPVVSRHFSLSKTLSIPL